MSNMRDAPVLKAVADVVKEHVGKAFDVLRGRINAVEEAIKVLPKPERGDIGPPGIDGQKGLDGAPGIQGEQGIAGAVGNDGRPGRDGTDGRDGANGMDGAPGKDGKDGIDGKSGADGLQGIQGEKGIDGKPGKDGEKGLDGKDGIQGVAGIKGLDGKDGRDGVDGKDAAPVDTKALAAEITEKVLGQIPPPINGADGKDGAPGIAGKDGSDGLNGKDGSNGIDGAKGIDGIDGIDGKDGIPGADGIKGLDGKDGKDGVVGERGEKGLDGKDGRDGLVGPQGPIGKQGSEGMAGRDALDIDILDGIDELASYQRGTYAHHRGGTIKAYRTTDPINGKDFHAAGWQVIQEGIADAGSALSADERTVVQSIELTSGKLIVSKYSIPTLIHKGTWKADQQYERGDFSTMAGSTWHCNQLTKDRPGTSNAWTLVVKRGSDGRDATVNGVHR